MISRSILLYRLQLGGLAFMMAGIPFANYFMSIAIIWLAAVWLLGWLAEGGRTAVVSRWKVFVYDRSAVAFAGLYLVFLVSLAWTSDYAYGLKDLRTKLPLLVLPLVMTGLQPVTESARRFLIRLYIVALSVAVGICLLVYTGQYNTLFAPLGLRRHEVQDVRDASIFISHIRFSLLLVTGILMLVLEEWRRPRGRVVVVSVILYFLVFLWLIESLTAFAALAALAGYAGVMWIRSRGAHRGPWLAAAAAVLLAAGGWAVVSIRNHFRVDPSELTPLGSRTAGGEPYFHDTTLTLLENGHYTMRHIAWGELAHAWEERSEIPFEGTDSSGNPLKGTLIRYMSSLGLRKDADGVAQLTAEDVALIGRGVPNATWKEKGGLRKRVDRILFEYDCFRNGLSPSGHSVFQRLEFWRAAWGIIRRHPWIGVGVGDVKAAFREEYERNGSPLDERHRLRAHNQFLTVWITGGAMGLLVFTVLLWNVVRHAHSAAGHLFRAFFLVALLSFLAEDTLESQAGVTFFAYFSAFLLFLRRRP